MANVNSALAALPWVEEHSVNFGHKSATLLVNSDDYDEAGTVAAVAKLGYQVSVL